MTGHKLVVTLFFLYGVAERVKVDTTFLKKLKSSKSDIHISKNVKQSGFWKLKSYKTEKQKRALQYNVVGKLDRDEASCKVNRKYSFLRSHVVALKCHNQIPLSDNAYFFFKSILPWMCLSWEEKNQRNNEDQKHTKTT